MKLINPLIILRILSTILPVESISFLFCIPVALIYKEPLMPFVASAGIAGFLYVIIRIETRNTDIKKLSNRDGFIAVTFSWLLLAVMGTLPYLISGTITSFNDALFESSSGFTTTGSTILKDVEILPYSILFWRSLTHWIGGLGIIVFVIIILPSLGFTAQQLFSHESSLKEKILPKTKAIGFRLLFVYLGLTVVETLLLWAGDMNLFDSICHTFSTVATGGFSTKNISLMAYSPYSQYVVAIFMFLSGVSFVLYYFIVKLKFSKVKNNEELWFYFGTVVIAGFIATGILMAQSPRPFETAFREGFFQVISFITTTGFVSADYLYWPPSGLILLFILLFAGASTGSSTGAIKMARHLLVIKNIKNVFRKLNHPNVLTQVRLNKKPLTERANISAISFVVYYLFIFIAGTILIVMTGLDPLTSASGVATSLGNTGPGLGQIGPMFNYSELPEISKFIFSMLMIIGRLEIMTVFALFSRSFWKL
jgi:trk system potassium uptake protein TrkH